MKAFEAELGHALAATDPPQGFADRVLARAASQERPAARVFAMPIRSRWAIGAIAALLLMGVATTEELHLRQERAKAAQADRQFQAAVTITSAIFHDVREELQQIESPHGR